MPSPELQYAQERKHARGASLRTREIVSHKLLGSLGPFVVYTVCGPAVRRLLDVDFTMGSHFAHSRFIPVHQIWVERDLSPSDLYPLLVHEAIETLAMTRHGASYESGHDKASYIERFLRKAYVQVKTKRDALRLASDFLKKLETRKTRKTQKPRTKLHSPTSEGFNAYRALPRDPLRDSPLRTFGEVHKHLVGSYWTTPISIPVQDLKQLKAVVQLRARLTSIQSARLNNIALPPIEIGVFKNGTGWVVDGNHRLAEARKAKRSRIDVTFTFIGT